MRRGSPTLRPSPKKTGFTLVELTVVTAICLAVAAWLYPTVASFRTKAYDSRALGALKDIAEAESVYFAVNGVYLRCTSARDCNRKLPTLRLRSELTASVSTGRGGSTFTARARHPKGSQTYRWDSTRNGLRPFAP